MSTFRCEACGGVFEKRRSDEEALAEYKALNPDFADYAVGIICEDCFKEFENWRNKLTPAQLKQIEEEYKASGN